MRYAIPHIATKILCSGEPQIPQIAWLRQDSGSVLAFLAVFGGYSVCDRRSEGRCQRGTVGSSAKRNGRVAPPVQ